MADYFEGEKFNSLLTIFFADSSPTKCFFKKNSQSNPFRFLSSPPSPFLQAQEVLGPLLPGAGLGLQYKDPDRQTVSIFLIYILMRAVS